MDKNLIRKGDLVQYTDTEYDKESKKNIKVDKTGIWDGEKVVLDDKEKTTVRNVNWLTKVEPIPVVDVVEEEETPYVSNIKMGVSTMISIIRWSMVVEFILLVVVFKADISNLYIDIATKILLVLGLVVIVSFFLLWSNASKILENKRQFKYQQYYNNAIDCLIKKDSVKAKYWCDIFIDSKFKQDQYKDYLSGLVTGFTLNVLDKNRTKVLKHILSTKF